MIDNLIKLASHGAGRIVLSQLLAEGLEMYEKTGSKTVELPVSAIKEMFTVIRRLEAQNMVFRQLLGNKGGYTDEELDNAIEEAETQGRHFLESVFEGAKNDDYL